METSDEIKEMEARERAKWMTIAAGKQFRKELKDYLKAIEPFIDAYDENPEGITEIESLIGWVTVTLSDLVRRGNDASEEILKLKKDINGN